MGKEKKLKAKEYLHYKVTVDNGFVLQFYLAFVLYFCKQSPCPQTHNLKDQKFSNLDDPAGIFSYEETDNYLPPFSRVACWRGCLVN